MIICWYSALSTVFFKKIGTIILSRLRAHQTPIFAINKRFRGTPSIYSSSVPWCTQKVRITLHQKRRRNWEHECHVRERILTSSSHSEADERVISYVQFLQADSLYGFIPTFYKQHFSYSHNHNIVLAPNVNTTYAPATWEAWMV